MEMKDKKAEAEFDKETEAITEAKVSLKAINIALPDWAERTVRKFFKSLELMYGRAKNSFEDELKDFKNELEAKSISTELAYDMGILDKVTKGEALIIHATSHGEGNKVYLKSELSSPKNVDFLREDGYKGYESDRLELRKGKNILVLMLI